MPRFPDTVYEAVRSVIAENPSDIELQKSQAMQAIRDLAEFDEIVDILLVAAVNDLIYDTRRNISRQTKNGCSTTKRSSDANLKVMASIYDTIFIGSKCIGDLRGSELLDLQQHEFNLVRGHQLNANILEYLIKKRVPHDKMVREVVTEKDLTKAIARIKQTGEA